MRTKILWDKLTKSQWDEVSAARRCRQGHPLIEGKTAYRAVVWRGTELTISETGHLTYVCFGSCEFGDQAKHRRLEGLEVRGGTRQVGISEKTREPVWRHRFEELRCRQCNRIRVAAHRAKKKGDM